jgi:hypothetical protein
VVVPGPLKLDKRCRDKIAADYEGREPWPPAASLFDIVRCCVVLDDPYAMAVLIAYLQKRFDVVRIKNRFENDEVEEVSAEQIQCEFYGAETQGEDTQSNSTISTSGTSDESHKAKMYRDVLVNIRDPDSRLIYEVQITLTGIAILKKSEQKIYSIMRMASGEDLLDTFVFSRRTEPSWARVTSFFDQKSDAERKKRIPEEKTAQDAGSAGLTNEVAHPQGMFRPANSEETPEMVIQPIVVQPTPEIVIQDESDQVLFGNLVCAPRSHCAGNAGNELEGQVASKVDQVLLEFKKDVERKADEQKREMDHQFDRLSAQNEMLRAQNEMLIEMLKKVEQQGKRGSEGA